MKVFLLTTGDGSDGNKWGVQGIYSSRELAEIAQSDIRESKIEEWEVDKGFFVEFTKLEIKTFPPISGV